MSDDQDSTLSEFLSTLPAEQRDAAIKAYSIGWAEADAQWADHEADDRTFLDSTAQQVMARSVQGVCTPSELAIMAAQAYDAANALLHERERRRKP